MASYDLEIKLSAQKELDALDDALLAALTARFSPWPTIPDRRDAKNSRATKINGAFGWAIGAWSILSTMPPSA